jgi:hypothetical protein
MVTWTDIPSPYAPRVDARRDKIGDALQKANQALQDAERDRRTLALAAVEGDTRARQEFAAALKKAEDTKIKVTMLADALERLDAIRAEERAAKREAELVKRIDAYERDEREILTETLETYERTGDTYQASLVREQLNGLRADIEKRFGLKNEVNNNAARS